MRYAYNETQQIVSGVIFYFEAGDEPIAEDVFDLIEEFEKPPTSVVWNGECMYPTEASQKLQTKDLAEGDWLGIRLTIDDSPLLKKILDLFKENYPALSQMVHGIEEQLFATKH